MRTDLERFPWLMKNTRQTLPNGGTYERPPSDWSAYLGLNDLRVEWKPPETHLIRLGHPKKKNRRVKQILRGEKCQKK